MPSFLWKEHLSLSHLSQFSVPPHPLPTLPVLVSLKQRVPIHCTFASPFANTHTLPSFDFQQLQFKVSRDIGVLQRRLHFSLREMVIGGG